MDKRTRKRIEELQNELKKCRTQMYYVERKKSEMYGTQKYWLLCNKLRFLESQIDELILTIEFFTRYPKNPK